MKKVLAVALVMALAVGSAFAGNMSVTVLGGFNTVSMTKMNDQINDLYELFSLAPEHSKTNLGGAWDAGIVIAYNVMPELSLGVKYEYVGLLNGEIKASAPGIESTMTFSGSIMPILLDAAYMVKLENSPVSLGAGVGLGYGIA